jgi:PAS domain S-box-containing protein
MKKRAIQYALIFLTAGVVITIFVGYVQRKTFSSYEENQPYIALGETVKNRIMKAHLSIEKVSAGDKMVDFDRDVLANLGASASFLQAAYSGESTDIGQFKKLKNEDTRAILKETILGVEKLAAALAYEKANATPAEPIPASTAPPDSSSFANDSIQFTPVVAVIQPKADFKKFDAQFADVENSIDGLITHINETSGNDRSALKVFSVITVILLSFIFIGLAYILYRQHDKSDRIVTENQERIKKQEESVTSLSAFIESISAGNFTVDLQLDGENNLSSTLLNMRDKLRENADNDRKRNWSTSGLAQIGEILRSHNASITELYDNIIRFVVKYTKSNQGGLFLFNEENEADKHLELVACYAFERKKFLQKKVSVGEGLIGQCYLEGERIYLVQVPQEYISITSGLGGSNPNALLIVPLKVNEKIYGVLELATFGKYEEYQIELVEKLAETIGSTISAVRINESTRILLEKTQQQAEEMRAQEEEMRQNMEELEATQEEMRRKEKHIEVMLETEKKRNEFNNKGRQIIIELSKSKVLLDGKWEASVEKISRAVGEHLKVSRISIFTYDEIMDQLECEKSYLYDQKDFSGGEFLRSREFPEFFRAVKSEQIVNAKDASANPATRALAQQYLSKENIQAVLILPYLSEGKLAGVISCEHTSQVEWSDDFIEFLKSCADLLTVTKNTVRINSMVTNLSEAQETLQTIIDNLPRAVFWKDRDLRIQGCNRIFASVAGLRSHLDLIGKTDFDMPWREHANAYRSDDLSVMESKIARIDQEEKNVNSDGKESWVLTSKVPVVNKEGEVVAVLGMFEDITDRKQKEADVNLKLKELEQLRNMLQKQKN